MRLTALSTDDALALAQSVDPAFRPVWDGRPPQEQAGLALYFLPHRSSKPVLALKQAKPPRILAAHLAVSATMSSRA